MAEVDVSTGLVDASQDLVACPELTTRGAHGA